LSYTVPSSAGPQVPRPPAVSAASGLLYLVAALQLIGGLAALATIGALRDAYTKAYQDYPDLRDSVETFTTAGAIIGLVVALLFAAGYVALGLLDSRGKNPARIVTWVVAGIGVCCSGVGLAGRAGSSALSGLGRTGGGTDAPDPNEVQRIVNDALPSWYGPTTLAVNLIVMLSLIAIIILLALPASNAFFRRPAPDAASPYPPPYPQQ
jgi:hypothetical protein